MREEILDKIEEKGDLPAFPDILMKLQKKIEDPLASKSDFAKLIEMEPTLSGNLLRLANNVYYASGRQEVKSLEVAINKLGMEEIRKMIYSLQLTELFSDNSVLDYFQFWRHCVAVANFTQRLSGYVGASKQVQDTAYLAGLLHDVGIMVFAYLMPRPYMFFLKQLSQNDNPLEEQEKVYFDIDHQELGALFIEKWWPIDPEIVHSVRYHHFPFDGNENQRQSVQLVNVADGICNNMGFTIGVDCAYGVFKDGAWDQLGMSLEDVDKIMEDVTQSMEQAMELLGYKKGKKKRI